MAKKKELIIIVLSVLVVLVGVGAVIFFTGGGNFKNRSTFASHTDCELFQTVPIMTGKSITLTKAAEVGSGNYMINADNTSLSEYKEYLEKLEKNGFEKHVDNGESGIGGDVYAAYYKKDNLLVHVCHMVNLGRTMITTCENPALSENLFYDDSYVANNIEGAKTTFHLQELYNVGNSFVFQLKNGHFIINDGGMDTELPYLLDYLESLAPVGEKPIIDLWVISHAHVDHMGVLDKICTDTNALNRIYVENVFFNAPTTAAFKTPAGLFENVKPAVTVCNAASTYFKSTDGDGPTIYRPRIGDHYYFNDITIDVIYSQELMDCNEWETWNSSTTVLMYTIEGQKVLITGDTDINCQKIYMQMYDREYFDLDVYQVAHHGKNLFNAFTNYCSSIGTLIYPTYKLGSASPEGNFAGRSVQNEYLKSKAKEAYTYADGTKVLTFPYEVGTTESLPAREWKYNTTPPKWKSVAK